MRIWHIYPVVMTLLLFCVAADKEPTIDQLKAQADAVLMKDDVIAVHKSVGIVFLVADELARLGKFPDAKHYYVEGLKAAPFDYDHHMAYADMLNRQKLHDEAVAEAQIVLRGSEDAALVEKAQVLAGGLVPHFLPLDELPDGKPTLVLVPMGKVDSILLAQEQKKLIDDLGITVLIRSAKMKIPEAARDPIQPVADAMRERWAQFGQQHAAELDRLLGYAGVTREDLKDDVKVAQFTSYIERKAGRDGEVALIGSMLALGKQWWAPDLVTAFTAAVEPYARPNVRFLGITQDDMFSEGNNFLFGERVGDYGVISYRRFLAACSAQPGQRTRLLRRLHLQALTSAGHVFGIPRCTDPSCPRAYPNSVAEQDLKSDQLCKTCRKNFDAAFGRSESP